MSKIAEEAALQAYPNVLFPFTPLDLNAYRRGAFINGYELAEKDLALTWEDMKTIVRIADGLMYSAEALIDTEARLGIQPYYEEVLKRFKEAKNED